MSGSFGVGSPGMVVLGRIWFQIGRGVCRVSANCGRLQRRNAWGRRERSLLNPAASTALQVLDMGKASIAADHTELPTSRETIHGRRRRRWACQHCYRLPGNQDHARAHGLGLLSVLLASVRRRFDCFSGRFHIFRGRRCCALCGWGWLGDRFSGCHSRRRRDGRWGWCNYNRRILSHFRLDKVLT